jgi:hypothetical protein
LVWSRSPDFLMFSMTHKTPLAAALLVYFSYWNR